MPKTKNLGKLKDRFEVRGGIINEFDFHQGQREFAEGERNRLEQRQEGQGTPEGEGQPQSEAERVAQLMEDARRKAEANLRRREKRGGQAPSKAAGKKKAARKSATGGAKKSAAKKSSAPKKSGGKKGAAKKAGAKKSGAKKGGARRAGK